MSLLEMAKMSLGRKNIYADRNTEGATRLDLFRSRTAEDRRSRLNVAFAERKERLRSDSQPHSASFPSKLLINCS